MTPIKKSGYTLVELLVLLTFISILALGCGGIGVAIHSFIAKFW